MICESGIHSIVLSIHFLDKENHITVFRRERERETRNTLIFFAVPHLYFTCPKTAVSRRARMQPAKTVFPIISISDYNPRSNALLWAIKDSTVQRQRQRWFYCYRAVGVQPLAPLYFWRTHKHAQAPGGITRSSRGQQER